MQSSVTVITSRHLFLNGQLYVNNDGKQLSDSAAFR